MRSDATGNREISTRNKTNQFWVYEKKERKKKI